MFSILRSIKIASSDNRIFVVLHKKADLGTAQTFCQPSEVADLQRSGWREGALVMISEKEISDESMQQAAWDIIDVFKSEGIAEISGIRIRDEYIPLKKSGKLDHDKLFIDMTAYDARGAQHGDRTRWIERTQSFETVQI